MQGKGWLLAGIAAAVVVASVPDWMIASGRWPLVLLAAIIGVALYFRSHWAASARALNASAERGADVSGRLERLADDLDRSAFVIRDNLEEVGRERSSLFLDGARSHATKLAVLSARCRGLASRLNPAPGSESPSPGAESEDGHG